MTKKKEGPHKQRPKRVYKTVEELLERTKEDCECRIWQGFMQNGKYPMVEHDGKQQSVCKLVWLLSGKPMRKNGFWGTRCGTLGCVAPDHIVGRTRKEHFTAMTKKLFSNPTVVALRNARIGKTRRKLTEEQVRELLVSDETHEAAARRLGVSATTIKRYRYGEIGATIDRNPWLQLLRMAGVK